MQKNETWLQIDVYDIQGNCTIKEFKVPNDWLLNQVKEEFDTIENFLNEYTSEESNEIYCCASLENMIICENHKQ